LGTHATQLVNNINGLTLSSEFVDELGLPVEHDVLLVLNGFFLNNNKRSHYGKRHLTGSIIKGRNYTNTYHLGGQVLSGLSFFDYKLKHMSDSQRTILRSESTLPL
jgi:hypothetical protein